MAPPSQVRRSLQREADHLDVPLTALIMSEGVDPYWPGPYMALTANSYTAAI